MTRLLTIEETASLLRKTPSQLRWLIYNSKDSVPASALIGNRRMFREEDVEAFIDAAFQVAS